MSAMHSPHTTEINRLANEALESCGLSHDLYVQNFSKSIDLYMQNMEDSERFSVIDEAHLSDYASPAEIKLMLIENESNGICRHGIDPDCCPAGCGEH